MSVSLPAPARADVPLQIRALDAAFGAEVLGLDLGLPLAAEDFRRIHRAHLTTMCWCSASSAYPGAADRLQPALR
ncbi:hypothetical protein P4200_00975 [Pseudomonas aeruginosa]|nr:hypothetical protein [Pseudomonas aeruginosa]